LRVKSNTVALSDLRRRVHALEGRPQDLIVPINTLANESLELIRPVNVLVEPVIGEHGEADEYLATFVDASIGASGDTVEEAVANLKDRLITTYQVLESMSHRLGPQVRGQLQALRAVIRERV